MEEKKEINVDYEANFLCENERKMFELAYENRDKVGFVEIWALDEKPPIFKFVEGAFNKAHFVELRGKAELKDDEDFIDTFWSYFKILWEYNHTITGYKLLYVLFGTPRNIIVKIPRLYWGDELPPQT